VKGYFLSEFYAAYSLHIYWIIGIVAIVIWTMQIKGKILTEKDINSQETLKYWVVIVISFLLLLIIVTLVSINSHDVLPGNHERF
jgi:heme/copper-type cytochrome/quinol oxidase subunit 3